MQATKYALLLYRGRRYPTSGLPSRRSFKHQRIRYTCWNTSSHTMNCIGGAIFDQLEVFDLAREALGFEDTSKRALWSLRVPWTLECAEESLS
jgi:hypothetical protein